MVDDPKLPPPPDPGGLQFDRAEAPAPEAGDACTACKMPLQDSYFLAGGQRICPGCRDTVQRGLESGSKGGRLVKATLLGLLAAVVSGAVWAFIIIQFDTVLGLLAIGLGLLVGAAVRKGSEGRGGRGYQFLAIGLTYFGIAVGYSGALVPMALKANPLPASTAPAETPPADPATPPATPAAPDPTVPADVPPVGVGGCLVAFAVLIGIGIASPFLIAAESPITLLFLAIALWEAWKLNFGISLKLSGPYRVNRAPPPEAKPGG